MGMTPRGIPYPDGSDVVSIKAPTKALAEGADAAIEVLAALLGGMKVQQGTFTLNVADTDSVKTVEFDVPFSGQPRIHCSVMRLGLAGQLVDERWGDSAATPNNSSGHGTATGFRFQARRTSGAASPIRVNWTAIGPA